MDVHRIHQLTWILPLLVTPTVAASHPIIPTFERFYAAEDPKADAGGRLLLGELGCTACHQAEDEHAISAKQAPILTGVAGRVKAAHLLKYIAAPQLVKPGTTMPSLFVGKSDQQVTSEVIALVQYLVSLGPESPEQAYPSASARVRGEDFYHKVGCVACHGPRKDGVQPLATSKPLGDAQHKYTLLSLASFLKNPLHTRPSGRMPSLNLTTREATDLAAFMLPDLPAKSGITWAMYKGKFDRLPDFSKLKPAATGDTEVIDINVQKEREEFALQFEGVLPIDTEGEYTFYTNSDDGSNLYVNDQKVVDNDGVHGGTEKSGKITLTPGRYAIRVDFFERNGGEHIRAEYSGPGLKKGPLASALMAGQPETPLEDLTYKTDAATVAQGRELFVSIGCASCHELKEGDQLVKSKVVGRPLSQLQGNAGCIAGSTDKLPNYQLSDAQRQALATVLSAKKAARSNGHQIASAMDTFNCYACHERGELGGVEQEHKDFFQTTQPEMGVEGSIPPGLDGIGAKLTPLWLKQILADGAEDRPYMHTRMPKFSTQNIGHLADLFAQTDTLKAAPDLNVVASREVKKHGWTMIGVKGLSCIKCHTFGRYKATGVQSIDLTIMTKRLQYDWFRHYMRDPQQFRRGTRMPAAWPPAPNKSFLPDILDGDSDQQIVAVWHYLADGSRARTPVGLVTDSMELIPGGEAIVYRNFIQGAGSRAIGVGYPEGINLAFDGNELRMALIWQGAFIDAKRHWTGRGQGYEPPAGVKVQSLPAGPAFAALESEDAAWPNGSLRETGARFKGYRITEDGRPTFRYQIAGFTIEDFPIPVEEGIKVSLVRKIDITGGDPSTTLYYRAASGKIEELGDGWYQVGELKIRLQGNTAPIVRGNDLLVPIQGAGEITQTYEW